MIILDSKVLTELKQKIQEAGFKLTPQRQTTLSILIQQKENLLSAEEIYILARNVNSSIGLATVYRTLEILTNLGILCRIVLTDGLAHYCLQENELPHAHHFLLCTHCGKAVELFEDLLPQVEQTVQAKYKFKVLDHHLTFHGICQECQEAAMAAQNGNSNQIGMDDNEKFE